MIKPWEEETDEGLEKLAEIIVSRYSDAECRALCEIRLANELKEHPTIAEGYRIIARHLEGDA